MTSKEELDKLKSDVIHLLGVRIQALREENGMSQVDLAGRMIGKFDTTNISRIESGRTNPTFFTLFRIAEALEISVSNLMDFKYSK